MQGFFVAHACAIHLPQRRKVTKKHKEWTLFLS